MLGRIVGKMSGGRGGKAGSAAGGQSYPQGNEREATYLVIDGNEVIFRSPHYGAAWAFRRGLGGAGAEAQATIAKVVSTHSRSLPASPALPGSAVPS